MNTRTLDELKDAVKQARRSNDVSALVQCVGELDNIAAPAASAMASDARGSVALLQREYPTALEHYQRALTLYEELGDKSSVALATAHIGNVHNSTGDQQTALLHYHRALALFEELDDRTGIAHVTGSIGIVHRITGDHPTALEHFHRVLLLCEELGDKGGVARITGLIGIVYGNTGDYPTALEHYHKALALQIALRDTNGIAAMETNIGIVLGKIGSYPTAIEHLHNALSLHEELGDRSGIARVLGSIGNVHGRAGDNAAALENFRRALALCEELGERRSVARYKGNIAHVLVATASYAEAEAVLTTMDDMKINDPGIVVNQHIAHATIHAQRGDLSAAAAHLATALQIATTHNLRSEQASVHRHLRELALQQNDLASYVEHNNAFTRITEEINGKDTATKLAMQNKQREIDAREKEHAKHMAVLHSTLPKHVAERVARGEVVNDSFDNAAVLFLDVVGFTTHTSTLDASVVVELLQRIFTSFDTICAEHDVMKIKTIGDSYMAVAFPSDGHVVNLATVACAMQVHSFVWPQTGEPVQFRIGLHVGSVVAGVLGKERLQYDVWGDTVNVASRMESSGSPGRIHVSQAFVMNLEEESRIKNQESHEVSLVTRHLSLVTSSSSFVTFFRGSIDIKGKGPMQTYWLETAL